MNKSDKEYLKKSFSYLLNYDANDLFSPIDPLTYKNPEGDSCLHLAAFRGDVRAVKILIAMGLNVNLRGDLSSTPLHYAVMNGNQEIIKILLDNGALPDLVNELGIRALPIDYITASK